MKSTSVKRGRPRKIKEPETLADIAHSRNREFGSEKKKLDTPLTATTSRVNREYHFKDGPTCTVIYSECKEKPVVVKMS